MAHRVLIIDDEPNIRRMLGALLRAEGYAVDEAPTGPAGLLALETIDPDAIFMDYLMPPGPDGLETLRIIRERGNEVPVIMMSGKAQLADAVRATQLGAFPFLEKPLSPEVALVTLRSALELGRARSQNRALREALAPRDEMVGQSEAMLRVRQLVAAAIHRASPRARGPFVPVNCAAIPRDLVESEMFGHERGAFTGAGERRLGRFELADGGTLFLDEIGDLNLDAQAKLLRTLETGVLQRLGAEQPTRVDVRVVAATNRRLEEAVRAGTFREDLYFRLNIFPIHLPPLRERLEDLPALVRHLTASARPAQPQTYDGEALTELAAYHWPGNIRELTNVVERLAILAGPTVGAEAVARVLTHRPARQAAAGPAANLDGLPLTEAVDRFERDLIARALSEADGNVAEAARRLKTDRANLYRRMKRLGVESRTTGAKGKA